MASSQEFIEFVCDQIKVNMPIRYRKMFGDYMIYVNDKPIVLVCDNTVYVKILEPIQELMQQAQTDYPYEGAKLHYILDIDDVELTKQVITILEEVTPLPKPKKKK